MMSRNKTTIYAPPELEGDLSVDKIDFDGTPDGYEIWYCGERKIWMDNQFALEMAEAIIESENQNLHK